MKSVRVNYIFNSVYQLTTLLVPLITMPYLSRVIRAKGIGEYSFAYSVAFYFTLFIKLGLNNYGNRTIASVRNDRDKLVHEFWNIYCSQFILAIAFLFIYVVYCFFIAPERQLAFLLIPFVISSGMDITWMFYGLEEFKIITFRDVSIKILTTILIFLFVKNTNDTWKYALILSTGYFFMQISVWSLLSKYVSWIKPTKSEVVKHIKPNLVLFIPSIAVSIYKTMDKIMLGVMSTSEEVGYYHSCENIVQVPMALVTSLGTVMLPRMSNMFSVGASKKLIQSTFKKSIEFAMFLASLLSFGIMTVAKEFVPLFYGKGFEKCVSLYYVLLPSCIFLAFANVIRTQYLIPQKKDILYISSLLTGAGVNAAINLLLIPHFQALGAAIGTLIAEASVCLVQTIAVRRELPVNRFLVNSIPYLISGMIMFGCLYNFSVPVENSYLAMIIKIILSGLYYMILLGFSILIKRKMGKKSYECNELNEKSS